MTASFDVTRRGLLSVAAATGGAVLGGPVVPGAASPATAQVGAPTTSKRLEGRDEPILDRDLSIIDAHHHLFVRPGQRYRSSIGKEGLRK
jgi:hypothetical protein